MIVGLEIVRLVSIAIKESHLPKMQLFLIICPTACQLLNTLPVCLRQIKENISPKGCFILPPSRKIGCFFLKHGRADKDKRQRKIVRPTEISRQDLPNPLLLLLAVKEKIATVNVENWIFKTQPRQILLQISHDDLVFPADTDAAKQKCITHMVLLTNISIISKLTLRISRVDHSFFFHGFS